MGEDQALFFELIIVLALVFYALWSFKHNNSLTSITPGQNLSTTDFSTPNTNKGGVVATTSTPVSSYEEAITKYKDTRIQLDQNCHARPSAMTIKNNSFVMVDNRAPVSRSVKVGGTFNLAPYTFKVIQLQSTVLPVDFYVNCDSSKNVATILLQK